MGAHAPVGTLLLTTLLAGCLGGAPGPLGHGLEGPALGDVEAFADLRLVQNHEHHREHDAHAGALGLEAVSFVPGRAGPYPDGETYPELAVKAGFAFLAFGPKHSGLPPTTLLPGVEAGVIIYDVRDPAQPREVGRWVGQPVSDVEVSDDANWAFVSTQRNGYPYPWTFHPDALPLGALPRGTYLLDVHDKSSPKFVSFTPLATNGPHTITYYKMPDGRELLLACTYDIVFTAYPQNLGQAAATQKVVLYEVVERAGLRTLEPLSIFQVPQPDDPGKNYLPHDATVHVDPATGRVVMDVAYWDLGLVTVDITDPARPRELARFADTGPSKYTKTHLARVFPGTIGGRVVAVLEPEIPVGEDAGQYTFVDVTDPAKPHRLGYWRLPGDRVVDKPFVFSPHNFDLACGGNGQVTGRPVDYGAPCDRPTVVLSHFHGGLWTLDASDPTKPKATGFFFPLVERPNVAADFPFTGFFTAFMVDGLVYAPEVWTGLHVLRPTPANASAIT